MERNLPSLITPTSSEWAEYAVGFAAAPNYAAEAPAAIAVCRSAEDVQAALQYAVARGLPFRVRGGRHNYEGHSSRVKQGVIIDMRRLNSIERISEQRFEAGAGVNMFELTEYLNACGQAMPYATGGTVGLAGFLMGGGVSVNSRLWGLGSMHVEAFRLIQADGVCHHVTPQSDPDLFWATLGGGAGNYGIATSFTLKTHSLATVGVVSVTWDWEQFRQVMDAWQHGILRQPRELTTFLTFSADRTIELSGQWTGEDVSEETITEALLPLFEVAAPRQTTIQCMPHAQATRRFLRVSKEAPLGWHDAVKQQQFKSTSSFADLPFPSHAIVALKKHLENHPPLQTVPQEQSMIRLLGSGGAIRDHGPHPVAAPHRQALFIVQYNGYWHNVEDAEAVQEWTNAARKLFSLYTVGAYSNYVDDQIPAVERDTAYFGDLAPRLRFVKKRVDPNNLFSFPHSLCLK
jgi:FAD/FMN-containing dehydrogenase